MQNLESGHLMTTSKNTSGSSLWLARPGPAGWDGSLNYSTPGEGEARPSRQTMGGRVGGFNELSLQASHEPRHGSDDNATGRARCPPAKGEKESSLLPKVEAERCGCPPQWPPTPSLPPGAGCPSLRSVKSMGPGRCSIPRGGIKSDPNPDPSGLVRNTAQARQVPKM